MSARSLRLALLGSFPAVLLFMYAGGAPAQQAPKYLAAPTAAPAAPETPAPQAAIPTEVENAVVKVTATVRYPDPFKPWTKQEPRDLTASGVVIEGKRVLTNAHAVLYANEVWVQASREGDKIPATVQAVAPGIDLAVLTLDDPGFFRAHAPIARSQALPQIKDAVLAYGFPGGGSSLSITKGIISRIEFVGYNFPVSGLRIQIDAAINPGNSGGPAIVGDRMVGLAFSRLGGDAQNIGYIIPNEEIELFLKDIADGRYDGKPAIYDELQTLENPALRAFLKIDPSVKGVVVHHPYREDAAYPLKEWDVISRIGDMPIDDQGMVNLGTDLRVSFRYLVQSLAHDGKVALTVVRAGKSLQVELPVSPRRPMLIDSLNGSYPSYFVYGPLVFSRATGEFVAGIESNNRAAEVLGFIRSPLVIGRGDAPSAEHEDLAVVSSPFFPNRLVQGYGGVAGQVVESVNGRPVKSLANLVALLRDARDEFIVLAFSGRSPESLVLRRREILAQTEEILSDNGVRAQGSADMLAIWNAKPH